MIPYTCPKCKAPVGIIVEVNGLLWLNSGGWLLAEARKHCHVCGNVVYFKRPKKTLKELLIAGGELTLTEVFNGPVMEMVR